MQNVLYYSKIKGDNLMLYSIVFEDYNNLLKRGIKKLNSYHSGLIKFGILLLFAACGLAVYSWFELLKTIPEGIDITIENLGVAINKENNMIHFLSVAGLLFLSAFSFYYHGKKAENKLKVYIEEIHPQIVKKHKSIFADHSEEAIKAFREERDEKELIKILETYQSHMEFILNNYSNFDRTGTVD